MSGTHNMPFHDHDPDDLYELSPRSSLKSEQCNSAHDIKTDMSVQPTTPQIPPSIHLLFSFISRRHVVFLLIPALFSSIVAGGIAPFMTFVVGQAFDSFSRFPVTPNPPQEAKDVLVHNVGIAALELIGLAVGSLSLSSVTSCLWIWIGEINVMSLRKAVYLSVSQKTMIWFDTQSPTSETDGSIGAGGLMAKFSRETDEVRMASSLASGMLVQYLTTVIACLVLAFLRSWALTLVILSAVPLLTFIQGFSQTFAAPLLAYEREQTGVAATIIERAVAAIATVKAFNAAGIEHTRASDVFQRLHLAARKLNRLWGVTSGMSQFVVMAMFVQGFWFGGKLVRDGHVSAGDVMAVFWACLIATSSLQMCIPQLIVLAKGKTAMAELVALIHTEAPSHRPPPSQRCAPQTCTGGLALHDVSFAYPARPDVDALANVSMFLPAKELTFIVGGSGSGKSTVAHLLCGLYTPQRGTIELDSRDLAALDDTWLREQVACVGQQGAAGVVVFEGKSVWENIAAAVHGHSPRTLTTKDVKEACRAALMHEFVRDLPQGYETILGGGAGVGLSGGQKQRLAIARARLRNPTVLILDEATSALDPTSRILVFEALKQWRRNKTTIVITHDLSQISSDDFVYVLKDGRVAEQGYRADLEDHGKDAYYKGGRGEFRKMAELQGEAESRDIDWKAPEEVGPGGLATDMQNEAPGLLTTQHTLALRPISSFGTWMFDVVADLTSSRLSPKDAHFPVHIPKSITFDNVVHPRDRPQSTVYPNINPPPLAFAAYGKRYSLPGALTPSSVTFTDAPPFPVAADVYEEAYVKESNKAMERSAIKARQARLSRTRLGRDVSDYVKVEKAMQEDEQMHPGHENTHARLNLWALVRVIYPQIPRKQLLFTGFIICLISGAMTPLFSFLLSRVLFEVSIGAQDVSTINIFGALVLGVAAIDGLLLGLKYVIMETCAMSWITFVRRLALSRVLSQDKKWFDGPEHGPANLVQLLIKDGEDARDLIAVVWGQCCVVCAMLGVGLVWAFIKGWQLTLAGLAIAPVFALTMALQSNLVARCEVRNKRAREEVARGYYNTIINIRAIRSMAFDYVFRADFEDAIETSLTTGVRGAFVEGCTHGIASGLIYLAEALLFYVGALLIARGTYTYLQMVEVLNLVVFSVTIGSQLMAFTERIAKSNQAASDLTKLTQLDTTSRESRGSLRPNISGEIRFNAVTFSYPQRPNIPVLRSMNLRISQGECVAIVGSSGCGKSTIASLLQRLYEPHIGSTTIGGIDTRLISVHHLREHISIVSQHPHLFDASISENIRYGHPSISDADIRCAAKAANIHKFIMSLPEGYDTPLGENASLISGGQAQRLQIARALARPSNILILDECTSSLDPENRAAILDTIAGARQGRTTIMITHNLEAMLMCDRILVVHDGEVVEQGSYDRLMERKGIFATLARGGEWIH